MSEPKPTTATEQLELAELSRKLSEETGDVGHYGDAIAHLIAAVQQLVPPKPGTGLLRPFGHKAKPEPDAAVIQLDSGEHYRCELNSNASMIAVEHSHEPSHSGIYLDRTQASQLAAILSAFAETGRLPNG